MMPCNKVALCNLFRVLATDPAFEAVSQSLFREALAIGIFSENAVDKKGVLLLTGLPTDVARVALRHAVAELGARRGKGRAPPLEVVTGRGKMKSFCLEMAAGLGLRLESKRGNPGRLLATNVWKSAPPGEKNGVGACSRGGRRDAATQKGRRGRENA